MTVILLFRTFLTFLDNDVLGTIVSGSRFRWVSDAGNLLVDFAGCLQSSNWRKRLMALLLVDVDHVDVPVVFYVIHDIVTIDVILDDNCRRLVVTLLVKLI